MGSSATPTPTQIATRDKAVPWYAPDLSEISPSARKLFENYSHIPPEQVVSHILEVRNRAWAVWPYPCIGQFRFLDLSISQSPLYPSVLSRLRTQNHTLLDLGCCFAQDVRKLVADGAPSENIWGSDLRSDFIDLGYKLFLDKETLKSRFVIGDVFDEESGLKELNGKIDIVYVGSFFHLFDWDEQVQIAKRLVLILRPRNGSLVLGRQRGNLTAGSFPHRTNAGGNMYRHNVESFTRMWKEVGEATGTEWKVEARLDAVWKAHGDSGKGKEWTGEPSWENQESRRLTFEVERLS